MTQQIKIEPLEPEQGIQAPLEKLFLYNPDAVKKIVADMNDALEDAEQSATDAANSADAAAKSATAAAASESAVKQSAVAAENAAVAAKNSENAAKTSETNAATSATDAANSASAAAKSATAAAESAETTQQNEEILQQYVDDAGQYATNAAASSQDAAGFANDAEQYAEEAKQATAGKADKATTLAGYGITDAYTKTQVDQKINDVQGDVDTLNTKVPSNASASNKMATAAEISNLQNQIDENALEIKGLQGAGGALNASNFNTATPTQETLTKYAVDQIWPGNTNWAWNAASPAASTFTDVNGVARTAAEIFNSTWVNNTYDDHRWQLTNTQNTSPKVFEWADVGRDIVSVATATTAGIVRVGDGSQMVVNPTTGDISLDGTKAESIRGTIGAVATNQGTANAGKILTVGDDGNIELADGASGAGRNIGDIFWTTRTDSALNGAVEANGAQYNIADVNGGDNNVQALLESGALPSVSISEFDARVASDGGCDAFGADKAYAYTSATQTFFMTIDPLTAPGLNDRDTEYPYYTDASCTQQRGIASIHNAIVANIVATGGEIVINRLPIGDTTVSGIQYYCWESSPMTCYTKTDTPNVGDTIYSETSGNMTPVSNLSTITKIGYGIGGNSLVSNMAYAPENNVVGANGYFKVPKKTPRILVRCQKPTADNDYTWYNLYADGWCEQGGVADGIQKPSSSVGTSGNTVVEFSIAMANNLYTPTVICTNWDLIHGAVTEATTTSMRVCGGAYNVPSGIVNLVWSIAGYAAASEYTKDKWEYQNVQVERPMVQLFNGATDEAVATCASVLQDVANLNMGDYVIYWDSADATDHSHAKPGVSTPLNHGWYRYYKSGWVEQGGWFDQQTTNVVYPVAMKDTTYVITAAYYGNDTSAAYTIQIRSTTTTGLTAQSQGANAGWTGSGNPTGYWKVEGYAA